MSGKVEISIDKWDEIRNENSQLKAENEDLKKKSGIVKIIISSKKLMGNLKYDRWKKKNVFVDKSENIERVEYANLDEVTTILKEEAEDKVKDDVKKKDFKIKTLDQKVKDYKKKVEEEKAESLLKHNRVIEDLKKELNALKQDKEQKKNENKIKELNEELIKKEKLLNESNLKIEDLEKTNMALLKRIPFWRRVK